MIFDFLFLLPNLIFCSSYRFWFSLSFTDFDFLFRLPFSIFSFSYHFCFSVSLTDFNFLFLLPFLIFSFFLHFWFSVSLTIFGFLEGWEVFDRLRGLIVDVVSLFCSIVFISFKKVLVLVSSQGMLYNSPDDWLWVQLMTFGQH